MDLKTAVGLHGIDRVADDVLHREVMRRCAADKTKHYPQHYQETCAAFRPGTPQAQEPGPHECCKCCSDESLDCKCASKDRNAKVQICGCKADCPQCVSAKCVGVQRPAPLLPAAQFDDAALGRDVAQLVAQAATGATTPDISAAQVRVRAVGIERFGYGKDNPALRLLTASRLRRVAAAQAAAEDFSRALAADQFGGQAA